MVCRVLSTLIIIKALSIVSSSCITEEFGVIAPKWKFIAPLSPWRLVGTLKSALKKTLKLPFTAASLPWRGAQYKLLIEEYQRIKAAQTARLIKEIETLKSSKKAAARELRGVKN